MRKVHENEKIANSKKFKFLFQKVHEFYKITNLKKPYLENVHAFKKIWIWEKVHKFEIYLWFQKNHKIKKISS